MDWHLERVTQKDTGARCCLMHRTIPWRCLWQVMRRESRGVRQNSKIQMVCQIVTRQRLDSTMPEIQEVSFPVLVAFSSQEINTRTVLLFGAGLCLERSSYEVLAGQKLSTLPSLTSKDWDCRYVSLSLAACPSHYHCDFPVRG